MFETRNLNSLSEIEFDWKNSTFNQILLMQKKIQRQQVTLSKSDSPFMNDPPLKSAHPPNQMSRKMQRLLAQSSRNRSNGKRCRCNRLKKF